MLSACGGGGGSSDPPAPQLTQPPPPPANSAPTAHAGVGQVALLDAEVTLYGGLSQDPDGDGLSYRWQFTSKPGGSQSTLTESGKTATFTADAVGDFEVSLVVNDGQTESDPHQVAVRVVASRSILQDGIHSGMWPNYAGTLGSTKHAPLGQINNDNAAGLEVAWRWSSPDNDIDGVQNAVFEATPLMIDGVLYTSTSFSQVAAINAATGERRCQNNDIEPAKSVFKEYQAAISRHSAKAAARRCLKMWRWLRLRWC